VDWHRSGALHSFISFRTGVLHCGFTIQVHLFQIVHEFIVFMFVLCNHVACSFHIMTFGKVGIDDL
jgi:hypothetical protein